MRRYLVLLFVILCFCIPTATAQWLPSQGVLQILPGTNISISPTNGYGIVTINATGASAGGSSGQIQYNNGGVLGGFTMNGDATLNTASGAITLKNTGTAGTYAFPTSVTTDAQGRITSITAGGGGGGTVTSVSTGNLSPLFTATVNTPTTTPALAFTLSNAAADTFFGNNTGGSTTPIYMTAVQAANILPTFTNTQAGLVPAGGAGSSSVFLNGTGAFSTPAGGITGSGAATQVTVWTGTSTVTGNSGFTYSTAGSFDVLSVGGDGTSPGAINIYNAAQTQAVSIEVPTLGSSPVFTLPSATWTGPTVAFVGATSQATATANIPVRNTSGAESFPTGAALTASTLTLGTNGGTGGTIPLNGGTSGTTTIAVPAAAGGTFTLPPVTTTWPTSNASGVLTNNGSGGLSWAAGGGTIGGSIANNEVAFGSGTNTISGSTSFAYITAATTLEIGDPGLGVLQLFNTGGSGAVSIEPSTNSFGPTTFTLPQVAVTEVASAAAVNNAVVLQSTAGARSTSLAPYAPGFGGDGSDGAITTWTKPQINATTVTVSTSTGSTTSGTMTINATSTVSFNSGAVLNSTPGFGFPGANSATAVAGGGPCPGFSGTTALIGGGGGGCGGNANNGGGIGGGASVTGGGCGGDQGGGFGGLQYGAGSGGGLGGPGGASNGGGAGGPKITIAAVGAIVCATGANVSVNGQTGGVNSTAAHGSGGGGGSGSELFFSQTSTSFAAGSCTLIGGAGANGNTTGGGGGGGAGGNLVGMSPSNTNNLVTATACAGGVGGTSTGNAGTAGNVGTITMVIGTPNAPLISKMESGGMGKFIQYLKRCDYELDEHGYQSFQLQLCNAVCEGQAEFIACMGDWFGLGGISDLTAHGKLYAIKPRSYKDVA